MNKEQKKFNKVIAARKRRKGRVLQYQQGEIKKSVERKEQTKRSLKYYKNRAKLIKDVTKADGRLLTDDEALGKTSKVKSTKAHDKKREQKNEEKSNA